MTIKRTFAGTLALGVGLALSGCNSPASVANRSLDSVNQPVVARTSYTLDLNTGYDGLPFSEQQRLAGWFDTMNLRYGDRIAVEDPQSSGVTRDAVAAIAARHGLLLSDGAPITPGQVQPGTARVVITRLTASVPGCPDWSKKYDRNYANATSPGYGCAVNSNIAAMVANPEDLLRGQASNGETVIMSSTKAIDTFRKKPNTGAGELKSPGTGGEN
ncbi:pilus assembly protein CpaD [Altererythrobacter aerius]|uniref:Pilus assembly protein CpaD n=1 Tax=Tsuneonella aeria TaxID=1837929 RepID=A0A6I4TCV5_9SPHN|nr:CpaD family pilus assembly protein [Tsuneonella aeria]MXO74893.1 pilus assembly protein CpaD [Tsuneonella aeria]